MSPTVQVLPQTLINQIAAGEVIVRPASAVRELVENAFDAGASHVRVEASRDGRSISVVDDGCGMDEENAKRAILRHSTSKIRQFDDLECLVTRGFRGEALASIIAVSRFELLTRRSDDAAGVRIVASGGRVERVEPVGTATGSTIHVRDLFYNTPARLKFLKSPAAEFNALVQILTQHALSRPDIGLTCVRDGAVRFDLPARQDLRSRIEELLGSTVKDRLLAVEFEREALSVRGYISRPEASRKDRRWQYLTVNGRPIAAKQFSYPLQEAYRGLLMQQRFPIVVLDIGLNLAEVDVNVHPTKEEVRFEDERKIGGLLHRAVNQTLCENNLMPSLEIPPPNPPGPSAAGPTAAAAGGSDPSLPFVFSAKGVAPHRPGAPLRDFARPARDGGDLFPARDFVPQGQPTAAPEAPGARPAIEEGGVRLPSSGAALALGDGPPPTPIGQVGHSYIVAELGDDLLLIDQHAAHEKRPI